MGARNGLSFASNAKKSYRKLDFLKMDQEKTFPRGPQSIAQRTK